MGFTVMMDAGSRSSNCMVCVLLKLEHMFLDSLHKHLWSRCSKTLTTVKDFLFPLPLWGYPDVCSEKAPWLAAILLGLNSMYGAGLTTAAWLALLCGSWSGCGTGKIRYPIPPFQNFLKSGELIIVERRSTWLGPSIGLALRGLCLTKLVHWS